ncbi:probable aspartyl protease At4g16563 [Lactuca sativa]|nr:probable aspartyl protease At4g16563 [Lactuca sativa]
MHHKKNETRLQPAFFLTNSTSMATFHHSILTLISILCLCFSPSSSSSSSQTTFKLSLTQHIAVPSGEFETIQHPLFRTLNYLVSSSLARAHLLKNPNNSTSEVPLFPRGNGGYYSVPLSFGSPSQKLSFLMDTGSSLVWFPCTDRYTCYDCPSSSSSLLPVFMPKHSSSVKILGCNNTKCGWVSRTPETIQCNATKQVCSYEQVYGSGLTAGVLLSETLHLLEGDVTDFAVGCSVLSAGLPEGILGFGRRPDSLPAQMGLKKFSYCLVSHQFDDNQTVSSELVLYRDSSSSGAGDGGMMISYTKFLKNPSRFEGFYYLSLQKITIGGKDVNIPDRLLVPGSDGNGGTIIDSGTTFTIMDYPIYDLVAKEFEVQMYKYKRINTTDKESPLCYTIGDKPPVFPELMFDFEGGAKLSLPMADYFSQVEPGVACMTILPIKLNGGPSIIIGNYQQQDIYVEYDLENGRFGFVKKKCN